MMDSKDIGKEMFGHNATWKRSDRSSLVQTKSLQFIPYHSSYLSVSAINRTSTSVYFTDSVLFTIVQVFVNITFSLD